MELNTIYLGDALDVLRSFPSDSIDCGVTSPPYYALRDYGVEGQLGREATPEDYIARMVSIFSEFKRVLKPDGTLWVNIADSYAGSWKGAGKVKNLHCHHHPYQGGNGVKKKDLIGIPWMLAFAMRAEGWYLRQEIIWHKPNAMPETVTDRCTNNHEKIFLFSKSLHYYFDHEAIQEPASYDGRKDTVMKGSPKYQGATGDFNLHAHGHQRWQQREGDGEYVRNKRAVWTVGLSPTSEAHFATYPPKLILPCIAAGCPPQGVVCDPFMGSGTTAIVSRKLDRNYVGIELNPAYVQLANRRIERETRSLFN